jgi:hypothetical protein
MENAPFAKDGRTHFGSLTKKGGEASRAYHSTGSRSLASAPLER